MSPGNTSPTLTMKVRAPEALAGFQALTAAATELKGALAGLGTGTAGTARLQAEVRELKATLATTQMQVESLQKAQASASSANVAAAQRERASMAERAAAAKTGAAEEVKATEVRAAAYATAAAASERAAVREIAAMDRVEAGRMRSAMRGLANSANANNLTYGQSIPALVAGYATGSLVKNTVQTGSEFQYQTAFSGALGGYSPEKLAEIRAELVKMGTDSIYGPLELAKGLRVLEQAGVGANEALKILPVSMKVAQQGETDLSTASGSLLKIMQGYDKGTGDIAAIGDALSYTASKTQASVTSLMESLKSASGIKQLYGVDLNSELALLGTLAQQGITGNEAGTLSRRMFQHMYTPQSPEAQRIMQRELQFTPYNEDGSRRDSREAMSDMMNKIRPYDQESQATILSKVFDVRGLKSATTLVNDISDAFGKLRKGIDESGGALDAFSKAMSGEVKTLWEQVKSNFQGALIDSFKDMEGPLKGLLGEMREFFKDESVRDFLKLVMMIPTGYGQIVGFATNPNYSGGMVQSKQQKLEQLNQQIDTNLSVNGFDPAKRGLSGGAIQEEQRTIANNKFLQELVAARDALQTEITRKSSMEQAQRLAGEYAGYTKDESARLAGRAPVDGVAGGTKRASQRTLRPLDAREALQLSQANDAEAVAAFRRERTRTEQAANDEQKILDEKHRYGLISETDYTDQIEKLNDKRVVDAVSAANDEIGALKFQTDKKWNDAQKAQNLTKQLDIAASRDRIIQEAQTQKDLRAERLKGEDKAAQDSTAKMLKEHGARRDLYLEQKNLQTQTRLMSPEDAAAALAGYDARKAYEVQIADQQAALDKNPGGKVAEDLRERIRLLKEARDADVLFYSEDARARTQMERSYQYGTDTTFRSYVDAARNSAQQARDAWSGALKGMEDTLVSKLSKGKATWSDYGQYIKELLIRIQVQRAMAGIVSLFAPSGGAGGGEVAGAGSGTIFQQGHSGGIIGQLSQQRLISPAVFAGAPRFHTGGLVGGEMPIIAQRGEGIFTPEQMSALAPAGGGFGTIRVEMHNEGTPQQITNVQQRPDVDGLVIRVFTKDVRNNGPISQAMASTFGLDRATG